MRAKTSYRRRRIELIVERLEAERKKLDIGIEAELEAEQREVESSIEVVGKLGIVVEVASIGVVRKLDTTIEVANIVEVAGKLDLQNSEVLDL